MYISFLQCLAPKIQLMEVFLQLPCKNLNLPVFQKFLTLLFLENCIIESVHFLLSILYTSMRKSYT